MSLFDPDEAFAPVVGLAVRYESGPISAHIHARAQIMFAVEGSMTVLTDDGSWVLPTSRALWLPPGVKHALKVRRAVELRTVYLETTIDWIAFSAKVAVLRVSPLLREMLVAVTDLPWDFEPESPSERFARAFCDRLQFGEQEPVHLPAPRDHRAKRLAEIYYADPSERRALSELVAECGASMRTLERLFLVETGMSIGAWIRQLRLMFALEKLADGASVSDAAHHVGFETPSSFVAAFKRNFGETPGRYFK